MIQVCLKVLAKIVERRLTRAAGDHQVLIREQTGFRRKEECVALYATLHQACRHRLGQDDPLRRLVAEGRLSPWTMKQNVADRSQMIGLATHNFQPIKAKTSILEAEQILIGNWTLYSFNL